MICPNLNNEDVKKEFNTLTEAYGEAAAYHIWNANNGNSMKNDSYGNQSILFKNILNNTGSESLAIKAKGLIYMNSFIAINEDNSVEPFYETFLSISNIVSSRLLNGSNKANNAYISSINNNTISFESNTDIAVNSVLKQIVDNYSGAKYIAPLDVISLNSDALNGVKIAFIPFNKHNSGKYRNESDYGSYVASTNTIYINSNIELSGDKFIHVVLHEAMHALTVNKLSSKNKSAVYMLDSWISLNEYIKKNTEHNSAESFFSANGIHGISNISEFVSELLSNNDILDVIKNVYNKEYSGFLGKIKKAIATFINIISGKSSINNYNILKKNLYNFTTSLSNSDLSLAYNESFISFVDKDVMAKQSKDDSDKPELDKSMSQDEIIAIKESVLGILDKASSKISYNEETSSYLLTKDDGSQVVPTRVSTIKGDLGYGFNGGSVLDLYSDIGTAIHAIAEVAFSVDIDENGSVMPLSKELKSRFEEIKKTEARFLGADKKNISVDDGSVFSELIHIRRKLEDKGFKFIASERPIGLSTGKHDIAGTIDLIAIDKSGNVVIFDFKTKITGVSRLSDEESVPPTLKYLIKKSRSKSGFSSYHESFKGSKSSYMQHNLQLSLYAKMLKSLGINNVSDKKYIIPISVTLDYDGSTEENMRFFVDKISLPVKELSGKMEADPGSTGFSVNFPAIELKQDYDIDKDIDSNIFNHYDSNSYSDSVSRQISKLRKDINKMLSTKVLLTDMGSRFKTDELKDKLRELNTYYNQEFLLKFIQTAREELDNAYGTFMAIKESYIKETGSLLSIPMEKLDYFYKMAESYDIVNAVSALFSENPELAAELDNESFAADIARIAEVRSVLMSAMNIKNEIFAKFIASKSGKILYKYREEARKSYIKEAYAKHPDNKEARDMVLTDKDSMNSFIDDYIEKNSARIKSDSENDVINEMKVIDEDISGMKAKLSSADNLQYSFVTVIVSDFIDKSMNAKRESLEKYKELIEAQELLESKVGNKTTSDPRKMYDFMLESFTDDNGKTLDYIVSKIPQSYVYERDKMLKETSRFSDKARKSARQIWFTKNSELNTKDLINDLESSIVGFLLDYFEKTGSPVLISDKEAYDNLIKLSQRIVRSYEKRANGKYSKFNSDNKDLDKSIENYYISLVYSHQVPNKTIYKNDKFDKLMNLNDDDPMKIYYKKIMDTIEYGDHDIPLSFKLGNNLPGINKTMIERVKGGENIAKSALNRSKQSLGDAADDTEYGMKLNGEEYSSEIVDENNRPYNILPIYYTNRVPSDDQSYDLTDIIYRWYDSVNRYKNLKPLVPYVNHLMHVAENLQAKTGKKASFVKSASKSLPFLNIEGNQDATIKAVNTAAFIKDFFEQNFYGKEVKSKYKVFGMNLDKVLGAIQSATSLRTLAFNLPGAINNKTIAEVNQIIEAAGSGIITPKTYAKASVAFNKALPLLMGEVGSRDKKHILWHLNEHFGVFDSMTSTAMRKNNKLRRLASASSLHFMNTIAEFSVQSKFLIAALLNTEALDSNGNVIGNMFEMYKMVNGKLALDERVANFNYNEKNLFTRRIIFSLKSIHGNYFDGLKPAILRDVMLRPFYHFRKFFYDTFDRRLFKGRYQESIKGDTEGYWRAGSRHVSNVSKYSFFKMQEFFGRAVNESKMLEMAIAADWNTLSDYEKQNVRKFATEVSIYVLLQLLIALAYAAYDDDKERKYESWDFSKISEYLLKYQLQRMSIEMTAYVNPQDFFTMLQSPIPSMSLIEASGKVLELLSDPSAEYTTGKNVGENKLKVKSLDLVPILRQIYRVNNIDDQLFFMQNN